MKILTILLILLQINTFGYGNYHSPHSNRNDGYSSVSIEQTYRGIGYTTSYSNGKFNSSVYNTNTYNRYNSYPQYTGTYTPGTSSPSSSRPGGPRRSPSVPTVNGYDSINGPSFGGGSNYDSRNNIFEGIYFWITGGSGESYADYKTYSNNKPKFWKDIDWSNPANYNNEALKELWYSEHTGQTPPWEPYMTPIGDPDFYLITALLFSYFIYIYMKKRRQQFLLYTGI